LSEKDATRRYTGLTDNLEARLKSHNQGNNPHTAKYRPWQIETAIAFRSREKAASFEKYLKSHSERAVASKHF
jgi:predicted GIY-YIG superfamily endonuclease